MFGGRNLFRSRGDPPRNDDVVWDKPTCASYGLRKRRSIHQQVGAWGFVTRLCSMRWLKQVRLFSQLVVYVDVDIDIVSINGTNPTTPNQLDIQPTSLAPIAEEPEAVLVFRVSASGAK